MTLKEIDKKAKQDVIKLQSCMITPEDNLEYIAACMSAKAEIYNIFKTETTLEIYENKCLAYLCILNKHKKLIKINMKIEINKLDAFTLAFLQCALWASSDDQGTPLDTNYILNDFSQVALERLVEDCKSFQDKNVNLLKQAGKPEQNGHDFFLTRNHHGAGFWDRGYEAIGEKLTEACKDFKEINLYGSDDDGKIYLD